MYYRMLYMYTNDSKKWTSTGRTIYDVCTSLQIIHIILYTLYTALYAVLLWEPRVLRVGSCQRWYQTGALNFKCKNNNPQNVLAFHKMLLVFDSWMHNFYFFNILWSHRHLPHFLLITRDKPIKDFWALSSAESITQWNEQSHPFHYSAFSARP